MKMQRKKKAEFQWKKAKSQKDIKSEDFGSEFFLTWEDNS